MRFIFFSKGGREIPSSRYRAYYLAEALESLGHTATVYPVTVRSFADFWRYFRLLMSAREGDIIFLQRTIYSRAFIVAVLIAYAFGCRFVFDIDDAVYTPPAKRTEALGRLAMLITCGSEPVLAWAKTRNRSILHLPNGLPLSIYTAREQEPSGVPVIGWIGGGPAHLKNLALLPPILKRLSEQNIEFRFRLIGAMGDSKVYELFEGLPAVEIVDALDWADPRQAVAEVKTFAVGVMPLTEIGWNQAKHFKALEYMAASVPVVASSAATLARILKDGGGFLVRTEEEWVICLSKLLRDPELRAREGKKGRALIEQSYSSEVMARSLLAALKGG